MDMDRLKDSVKQHEGYRNKVYLDTLGKRTVGVGHLCVEDFWEDDKEYSEKFLLEILESQIIGKSSGMIILIISPFLKFELICIDSNKFIMINYRFGNDSYFPFFPCYDFMFRNIF